MSVLRVGVTPWGHLKPECIPESLTGCKAGVELDILYTIAAIINVNISLVIANGTGCGKTPMEDRRTNAWSGLLKMLKDGKIDIIGNFCDVKKLGRIQQDFFSTSWPIWQYREQFVIQTPIPPPITFAPFAPFSREVWIGCFIMTLLFLSFVTFYYYLEFGSAEGMFAQIRRAITALLDTCCGYRKHTPATLVWMLWIKMLTLMFFFYNTYILSAVLHPFPVWRPFSDNDGLVAELSSGRYRLLSHKNPPTVPAACSQKEFCENLFNSAVQNHGYEFIAGGSGYQLLSAIVQQNDTDSTNLVLVQGEPFLKLYMDEYRGDRSRLWLIDEDESLDKWSAYVWRSNLSYAKLFNKHIMNIGDYKTNALSRYLRFHGTQPYTGDRYFKVEKHQQSISVMRFRGLIFMHISGMATSIFVCVIENVYVRYIRRKSV